MLPGRTAQVSMGCLCWIGIDMYWWHAGTVTYGNWKTADMSCASMCTSHFHLTAIVAQPVSLLPILLYSYRMPLIAAKKRQCNRCTLTFAVWQICDCRRNTHINYATWMWRWKKSRWAGRRWEMMADARRGSVKFYSVHGRQPHTGESSRKLIFKRWGGSECDSWQRKRVDERTAVHSIARHRSSTRQKAIPEAINSPEAYGIFPLTEPIQSHFSMNNYY